MRIVDGLKEIFDFSDFVVRRHGINIITDDEKICFESRVEGDENAVMCFRILESGHDDNDVMVLGVPMVERGAVMSDGSFMLFTNHLINEGRIRRVKEINIFVDEPNLYRMSKFSGWKVSRKNTADDYDALVSGKGGLLRMKVKV